MVFRALHHVEKDQPTTQIKTVPKWYLEREVLLMMLRTAIRSAMTGSYRVRAGPFGCPYFGRVPRSVAPMLHDRNILFVTFHRFPARNLTVPHGLSFCGVMAGPLGDWLRV